jgi:hypothetical protein
MTFVRTVVLENQLSIEKKKKKILIPRLPSGHIHQHTIIHWMDACYYLVVDEPHLSYYLISPW